VSRRGWLLFVALCIVWGIPYMFTRIAVREVAPPTLVFLRTLPAALLLIPFALHRRELRPLLAHWRWIVVYTAAELALPWLLLSHAQQRISSSLAGLLVASVPLIAAVLYGKAGGADVYDWRRKAGLIMGFAGVAALVGIDVGSSDPLAIVEVTVVALCFATGPYIVSRRLADVPILGVIAASLLLNALIYTPAVVLWPPASLSRETIVAVLVLSLVCTALAFLLFFNLVREVGPSRTTIVTYVNPLVAVLLGVVVLSEPFTLGIAVGMPLVLLGSALATAPSRGAAPSSPTAP
jgi:drug/metabolite transporter (DMT)-like permease